MYQGFQRIGTVACCLAAVFVLGLPAQAQPRGKGKGIGPGADTEAAAMVTGLSGWNASPLFTVGEAVEGYRPPGILDGLGAMAYGHNVVRVFANHELTPSAGYPYTLANGTSLTGARVSTFDFHRTSKKLLAAGPAYDRIVDRGGLDVTDAAQLGGGLNRLCSSALFAANAYGLVDAIYFTGEETDGGTEYALDVHGRTLYAVPWMGRAAWENVTLVDTGDPATVGIMIGDDREAAPLLLYVGEKNYHGDGSFLDRNGLSHGTLYAWTADTGDRSPQDWSGTGTSRAGTFVAIAHYDDPSDGVPAGYDALGFATQDQQDELAAAAGAFQFSRPEDVATNPADGTQVVLASTGRGSRFPTDNWGTTYLVDLAFGDPITATLTVLYDGDDAGAGQFAHPDDGLRSPDNLDWADDGMIYVQEDRSTSPDALFGGTSGEEASIWALDPANGHLTRIGVVDRTAVPADQTDPSPTDIGNWETSGILDVTDLFLTLPGERLLLLDTQAHSLRDGAVAAYGLVQGGQLLLLSSRTVPPAKIGADRSGEPSAFRLEPNYPNPFNPATTIRFSLQETARIRVAVYDLLGRQVRQLVNGTVDAGAHQVTFAADGLASGTYLVRMDTPQGTLLQRIQLAK